MIYYDAETEEEETIQEESEKSRNELEETGEISVKNSKHKIHVLSIIGQIEGHTLLPPQSKTTKYEHVIPQLAAVERDVDIEGLLILLNTIGGDVEAGLAIAEMISNLSKPTVSLVLGGGHSIGVPLATAAKYSFIASSATMTIHPIRMNGVVIGASPTYEYFNRIQEQVVSFITKNSKISKAELKKLMLDTSEIANDVGTILYGAEAVEKGLINEIGGISHAMEKLYDMIENEA